MNFAEELRRIWSALRHQVVRGTMSQSAYSAGGTRTMLSGIGFEGENHQGLELLLPYGMSAKPIGRTADYLVFQINAVRDHKVAVGCDDPALRIPDLQPGEIGLRNFRGSQVVLRVNKIEITAPLDDIDVAATVGNVNIGAAAGSITLTAKAGQITANGKVLG
jgi:phage gp45-like